MKLSEKKRVQCASGVVTSGCGGLSGIMSWFRKSGTWHARGWCPPTGAKGHGKKKKRCKKGTRRVGGKCRRKGRK